MGDHKERLAYQDTASHQRQSSAKRRMTTLLALLGFNAFLTSSRGGFIRQVSANGGTRSGAYYESEGAEERDISTLSLY